MANLVGSKCNINFDCIVYTLPLLNLRRIYVQTSNNILQTNSLYAIKTINALPTVLPWELYH